MKKRKIITLFGAMLGGSLLVGGTFAAWIVTDNADPVGIQITPANVDFTSSDRVVLEWGNKGSFTNISGLAMNVEVVKSIGIRANISGKTTFEGNLSGSIETTSAGTGTELLKDHLKIIAKDGDTVLFTIDPVTNASTYSGNHNVTVTNGIEKTIDFYFTLDNKLTAAEYEDVSDDTVTFEINWDKASDTDVVSTVTNYYFKPETSFDVVGKTIYAYAWNDTTGAANAAWPGVPMNRIKDETYTNSIYMLPIENDKGFDKVIFNNGTQQTEDLTLNASTPYYDRTEWAVAPSISAVDKVSGFYLATSTYQPQYKLGVADYKLVPNTNTSTEGSRNEFDYMSAEVTLDPNTDVYVVTPTYWYSMKYGSSDPLHIEGGGRYVFYFSLSGVEINQETIFVACEYKGA